MGTPLLDAWRLNGFPVLTSKATTEMVNELCEYVKELLIENKTLKAEVERLTKRVGELEGRKPVCFNFRAILKHPDWCEHCGHHRANHKNNLL